MAQRGLELQVWNCDTVALMVFCDDACVSLFSDIGTLCLTVSVPAKTSLIQDGNKVANW